MAEELDTAKARLADLLRKTQAREEALGREGYARLPTTLREQLAAIQPKCEPTDPDDLDALKSAEDHLRQYHALMDDAFNLLRQEEAEGQRQARRRQRNLKRWALRLAVLGALGVAGWFYLQHALAEEAKRCAVSDACIEGGQCGSGLRFTGAPGIGCAPRDDDDCRKSRDCRRVGRCHLVDGVCAAADDEDCRQLEVCSTQGLCTAVEGLCQAVEREDCLKTGGCRTGGECSPVDGKCAAAEDSDCAEATVCKQQGACTAVGGRCVVPDEGFEAAPSATATSSVPPAKKAKPR